MGHHLIKTCNLISYRSFPLVGSHFNTHSNTPFTGMYYRFWMFINKLNQVAPYRWLDKVLLMEAPKSQEPLLTSHQQQQLQIAAQLMSNLSIRELRLGAEHDELYYNALQRAQWMIDQLFPPRGQCSYLYQLFKPTEKLSLNETFSKIQAAGWNRMKSTTFKKRLTSIWVEILKTHSVDGQALTNAAVAYLLNKIADYREIDPVVKKRLLDLQAGITLSINETLEESAYDPITEHCSEDINHVLLVFERYAMGSNVHLDESGSKLVETPKGASNSFIRPYELFLFFSIYSQISGDTKIEEFLCWTDVTQHDDFIVSPQQVHLGYLNSTRSNQTLTLERLLPELHFEEFRNEFESFISGRDPILE